jgi:hypothetical protein
LVSMPVISASDRRCAMVWSTQAGIGFHLTWGYPATQRPEGSEKSITHTGYDRQRPDLPIDNRSRSQRIGLQRFVRARTVWLKMVGSVEDTKGWAGTALMMGISNRGRVRVDGWV